MKNNADWRVSLVEKFKRQKILVVGDLMLDRYVSGSVERISPEAPVPVVRVMHERSLPGGAANVAKNIQSLGGSAVLGGVIGRDAAGDELMSLLAGEGIGCKSVLALPCSRTTVKTRVLADRQQVVRLDWDESVALSNEDRAAFCEGLASVAAEASGIIIEDYGRGCVSQDVVSSLLSHAAHRNIPVALDPKENFELMVNGITVATPNRKEAFALAGMTEKEPAANPLLDLPLLRAAELLMSRWSPSFLVITLGPNGMLLVTKDGDVRHIGTVAREVFDVSGAGDTVIAAMILGLASGSEPYEAAQIANCAAGVVVGKAGTAVCSAGELLKFQSAVA